MLTCEQFDIRVQDLMDQRVELQSDSLLCEHADRCSRCQQLMESFLSLEDSFSGKIPASYFEGVDIAPTRAPARIKGLVPLSMTLAAGILIGLIIANIDRPAPSTSVNSATETTASRSTDTGAAMSHTNPPRSGKTKSGKTKESSTKRATDNMPSGNSVLETDRPGSKQDGGRGMDLANSTRIPLVSLDQFRRQYPTLDLYYRLSDEIPGIRTIKDSFRVAWEWVERGLPFHPFDSH